MDLLRDERRAVGAGWGGGECKGDKCTLDYGRNRSRPYSFKTCPKEFLNPIVITRILLISKRKRLHYKAYYQNWNCNFELFVSIFLTTLEQNQQK